MSKTNNNPKKTQQQGKNDAGWLSEIHNIQKNLGRFYEATTIL
jgi:hypothetical protein